MLNERSKSTGIDFDSLMQADFVLYLRGRRLERGWTYWWPETLVYVERKYSAFEKFARSSSRTYFERFKAVLDVKSADEFREFCAKLAADRDNAPRWQFTRVDVATLTGIKELATSP